MSFLPSTGTIAVLFTAVPVGLVAAFIAMNPAGFLAMLAASGAFIVAALVGLVNMGFAGLYYVGQIIITTLANLFIGLIAVIISGINGVIHAILQFLKNIPGFGLFIDPSKFPYMPVPGYLTFPNVPGTLSNIISDIQNGFSSVTQAYGSYWSGVQANAPGSYTLGSLAGVGAGGSTALISQHEESPPKHGGRPPSTTSRTSSSTKTSSSTSMSENNIESSSKKSSSSKKPPSKSSSSKSSSGKKPPTPIPQANFKLYIKQKLCANGKCSYRWVKPVPAVKQGNFTKDDVRYYINRLGKDRVKYEAV